MAVANLRRQIEFGQLGFLISCLPEACGIPQVFAKQIMCLPKLVRTGNPAGTGVCFANYVRITLRSRDDLGISQFVITLFMRIPNRSLVNRINVDEEILCNQILFSFS